MIWRKLVRIVNSISPNMAKRAADRNAPPFGGMPMGCISPFVLALVVTVMVAAEDVVPLSVIEAGETEQVARLGAPLQLSVTV